MIIKKVLNKLYRLMYSQLVSRKKIDQLINSDEEYLKTMGNVFQESLNVELSQQEEKIRSSVEEIRKQLIDSDGKIAGATGSEEEDSLSYLARVVSKKEKWAILLMKLISHFDLQKGLEFGTCIGISAAYQAGIMKAKAENGGFVTMEGIESRYNLAKENFEKLSLNNIETHFGVFNEILPGILEKHENFDYLFIDGDHRHKATVNNFGKVLPHLKKGAIVVVDDIKWSKGMKRAWSEIKKYPEVIYSFDLFLVGICIVKLDTTNKKEFKLALW